MAVRVALLQMNCSGSREENMVRAEQMIREAAGKNAQILLLPEVFHELFFITDLNSPLLRYGRADTRPDHRSDAEARA